MIGLQEDGTGPVKVKFGSQIEKHVYMFVSDTREIL